MKLYWLWWIASLGLLFLELLMPATFFLWSAVAAIIVGFMVFFIPDLHFAYQLLAFGLFSIVALVLSRLIIKQFPTRSEQPYINQRGAEFIGKTYSLTKAIENGSGYLEVGGSHWRVEGPDCPVGTKVRVIGIEGVHLKVEPLL